MRFHVPNTVKPVNYRLPASRGLRGCRHCEEIAPGTWAYCLLDKGHDGPHKIRPVNHD